MIPNPLILGANKIDNVSAKINSIVAILYLAKDYTECISTSDHVSVND